MSTVGEPGIPQLGGRWQGLQTRWQVLRPQGLAKLVALQALAKLGACTSPCWINCSVSCLELVAACVLETGDSACVLHWSSLCASVWAAGCRCQESADQSPSAQAQHDRPGRALHTDSHRLCAVPPARAEGESTAEGPGPHRCAHISTQQWQGFQA